MVDAELFLRYLAFSCSPFRYRGNLKVFLDDTSRYFNEDWATQEAVAEGALSEFGAALRVGLDTIGRDEFSRKWSIDSKTGHGRFERALNRAIFDVQAYSLSFADVREAIGANALAVMTLFKKACEDDETFVRAISATTKTADAFITRHRVWMRIVHDVTGVNYPLPEPLERA
jgi:hypothetical protein